MPNNKNAFLLALIYSDIFNYPLTLSELWVYAIGQSAISERDFKNFLKNLPEYAKTKEGYFFLKGRSEIVKKRKENLQGSEKKLLTANKIANRLSIIPYILLIGVSGSVAMKNADKADDIDLFIVCKKNTIWQTRLLSTLLLAIWGVRRKRASTSVSGKICLNMLIDEKALSMKKRQDMYTAHEIVQMQPLVSKDEIYEKFLNMNTWVNTYLPNAIEYKKLQAKKIYPKQSFNVMKVLLPQSIWLEKLAKHMQLWYMNRHRTIEEVSDRVLAFHPIDYRNQTIKKFTQKKKKYEEI